MITWLRLADSYTTWRKQSLVRETVSIDLTWPGAYNLAKRYELRIESCLSDASIGSINED